MSTLSRCYCLRARAGCSVVSTLSRHSAKKKRVFSRVTRVCREVLQPPTNARVSGICHADDHIIEFETASERQQFQHIEDAEGFSTAAKLSYSGFGVSAAAGMSTDSSSSSSSNSSSTTTQYQFSRQMTTVIRFRHVSLDPEALRLAEGPASALLAMDGARMLDAALRDWIDRYGNHVQLDFDLGGHMAMSVTQADYSSSFSSESKESVRKAFSAAAAGGGWGVKASVSVAKESSEASASSSAAASSVSSVNIETVRRGGSPASSTIADFATSLAADYRSWIVVDVGPERYPLWKVAKNTFEGVPAMQKVWLRLKQLTEPSFTGFNIADMVHRIPDARQLKDFIGGEPSKLDAVLGKGVNFAILRERPERAPTAPVRAGGRRPRR
mmetsp:Transcript_21058/g.62703  ORF Transcript_21058/g.62703 Transcript_21058/m.62703 type:complete len:385 (-) Transcript_21058:56-1210(-)